MKYSLKLYSKFLCIIPISLSLCIPDNDEYDYSTWISFPFLISFSSFRTGDVDFESCEIISSIYTTMSTQTFPPMHSSLAWHTRKEWQTSCHEISLLFSSRVEELERRNYTQLSSTPCATIQLEASSFSPLRRRARERRFHNEQRTWINKIKNSISTKFAFSIFTFIHFVRVRLPDMRVGLSGWLEISAILHFVYLLCTGFSLSLSVVCCVRTKHFIPHDALLLSHWIIMQKYLISSCTHFIELVLVKLKWARDYDEMCPQIRSFYSAQIHLWISGLVEYEKSELWMNPTRKYVGNPKV